MGAAVHDIEIEQRATFQWLLTWKDSGGTPIKLGGYSARMQVRSSLDAATALIDLSSEDDDEIVLGGDAGTISITISAAVTEKLTFKAAIYDLFIYEVSTGYAKKLLRGTITLIPAVTR